MMGRSRITVAVKGIDRLQQKLGALETAYLATIRREVMAAALNVQAGAKRRAPVDTGRLRNSIAYELTDDGMNAAVGSNLQYAPAVEFGRRAGTMPPPGSLLDWMRRHGIPAAAEFAVRLKIARTAQPPRPFLFPSLEEERPKFRARLARALERTARDEALR